MRHLNEREIDAVHGGLDSNLNIGIEVCAGNKVGSLCINVNGTAQDWANAGQGVVDTIHDYFMNNYGWSIANYVMTGGGYGQGAYYVYYGTGM